MAKETSAKNVAETIEQQTPDTLSALPADIVVNTGKLDADQYTAEDLDGVTESLFGSGNLNYLMLQARQA
ncbi:MAG: hypothetical protein OXT65_12260, partial [Alphaproteobacteria bacterium]|nr:hypothetical protein [Alphaproteobacteria bacterium]